MSRPNGIRIARNGSISEFNPIGVIAIAVVQIVAFVICFSVAFAMGDAGTHVPWSLGVALAVLNAPLMYLLELGPVVFGPFGRWWGDDSNLIFGLAVLNALLWGVSGMWIVRRFRRRSTT
jgi:hypothetical protein